MMQMRHNAIVCNIGHFDNEIDMAGLEMAKGSCSKIKIKDGTRMEVHQRLMAQMGADICDHSR